MRAANEQFAHIGAILANLSLQIARSGEARALLTLKGGDTVKF